jgi:hypothetical protein
MVDDGIASTVDKNYIRNTGDISGLITSTVDQDYIRNTGNISSLITNTVDDAYISARMNPPRGRPFSYRGTSTNSVTKGGFSWADGETNAGNAYMTFSIEDLDGNTNIPKFSSTSTPTVNGDNSAFFPITISNSSGDVHMHGTIRAFKRVDISSGLRTNRAYFWSQDNLKFWNGNPLAGFNLGQTYYIEIGGLFS